MVGKLGWGQSMWCLMDHGLKSGFYAKCNGNSLTSSLCFKHVAALRRRKNHRQQLGGCCNSRGGKWQWLGLGQWQ